MILATHNGTFHTDDVCAIAVLGDIYPRAQIIRTRDQKQLNAADIVVDVGKVFDPVAKRFDHHQRQAGARPNGIVYSGFGLVWQAYGLQFCDNNRTVWSRIDQQFVQHIDAHDNGQKTYNVDETGVEPYLIEDVIRLYNPSPLDDAEAHSHDARFLEAVAFARTVLHRLKKIELETFEAEALFTRTYHASSDSRYVVLDKKLPYKQLLPDMPELLYVLYPYEAGGSWMVEAAPTQPGSFETRKPFPKEWRGKNVDELRALTAVSDVIFCHNSGFIAGATSKAGAHALLQASLES